MNSLQSQGKILLCSFLIFTQWGRTQQSSSSSENDFERDVLDEHNKYRAVHGAESLKLDEKLTTNATKTAEQAAESGNFDSISPGQSVFMSCATFKRDLSGKEVTDAW